MKGFRHALAGTLAVGAAARASRPVAHLDGASLIPVNADAAYHLRRASSFLEAPVGLPSVWDPFLGYPQGAPVPWAPGWDAWLALWGGLGGLLGPLAQAIGFGVAPVIAALLTIALVGVTGRRLWGPRAGLIAAALLALTPQHVAATQFANLDHNAIEGLALLWLAAESTRERVRPWAVALGIAAACLGWVGGLMYAGLGMGALTLGMLVSGRSEALQGMALGTVVVALVAVPMGIAQGTPFTYALLSGFHPAALAGLTVGAAWLFGLRTRPAWRAPLLAGGVLALIGGAVGMGPFVWEGLTEWLLTGDPWLATIPEMQSIFEVGNPLVQPAIMLTWGFFLLPIALILLVGELRTHPHRIGLLLVTLGALLLTLLQNRFGWTLAPLLAVVLAGAASRFGRASLVLVLVPLLWPPAYLEAMFLAPKARQFEQPWAFEAYRWLRDESPPVDPTAPEYGILGIWDHGHWLSAISGRPEYIGHFGTYAGGVERFEWTEAMYSVPEAELVQRMEREQLRYLVVEAHETVVGAPLEVLRYGGSANGGRGHLSGLRPVFCATAIDPRVPGSPGAWVYERVLGATLVGESTPGAEVQLATELQWGGAVRPWRASTTADASGRWSLRIPIWTQAAGAIPSAPAIVLVMGDEREEIQVSEAGVREGAVLLVGEPSSP